MGPSRVSCFTSIASTAAPAGLTGHQGDIVSLCGDLSRKCYLHLEDLPRVSLKQ